LSHASKFRKRASVAASFVMDKCDKRHTKRVLYTIFSTLPDYGLKIKILEFRDFCINTCRVVPTGNLNLYHFEFETNEIRNCKIDSSQYLSC
jgi:hypothetical protein